MSEVPLERGVPASAWPRYSARHGERLRRLTLAALVFAVSAGVSLYSLHTHRQLDRLQGMGEEYIDLGWDLQATGTFRPDGKWPGVFRPPGYSLFIAGVLAGWGHAPARSTLHTVKADDRAQLVTDANYQVYYAQGLLLAAAAALLFLWLARYTGTPAALIASLLLGTNPYLLICVGFLHYEVLHVFLLVAGCAALDLAFVRQRAPYGWPLAAGVLFGLATLVRPLTLLLPLVLLVVSLFMRRRRAVGPVLVSWFAFALGMALTIAPCTVHNYNKTGRLIPVNAQSWTSVWAGTMEKPPPDANRYHWWRLLADGGRKVMRPLTPKGKVDYLFFEKPVEVEDAFRAAALANLQQHPGTYAYNALQTFVAFNSDMNTSMLVYFAAYQGPYRGALIHVKEWLSGKTRDLPPPQTAEGFGHLVDALQILALCGAVLAIARRHTGMSAVLAVYLTLALAHSVTFIEIFYYYAKLPFVIAFAGFFIGEVGRARLRLGPLGRELSWTWLFGAPLLAANTALLWALL